MFDGCDCGVISTRRGWMRTIVRGLPRYTVVGIAWQLPVRESLWCRCQMGWASWKFYI